MSVIDDVKQRLDIVQIVSEYTKLQKSGRNHKASCPFHSEKTPSFFVFPERQSWHCFGACGTGGDIFSFVMKKEGIDFGQALQLLANKAGITLVPLTTPERQTQNKERERLFEINEAAAEYYHHLLLNTSKGEIARDYVAKRELSAEIIKNFQLGFAPEGWDTLKQYLKGKGYGETELLAAGLLVEREDRNNYDRFRNRLMFPIRNIQGKLIGFGGRALDDSLPKYLTHKQLAIIKNLTRNLILALDADTAGEEAISRSGEMLDKMLPVPQSFYGWVRYEDAHNAEVKILIF